MMEGRVLACAMEELLLVAQEEGESTREFASMEQRQQELFQRN